MILAGYLAAVLTVCSRWQIDAKTIDTSPGLDFAPRPDPADPENTLINYKSYNETSVNKWTSKIEQFLERYKTISPKGAENIMNCSPERPPRPGLFCHVDLREFQLCSSENKYNYHRGAPCVFLKLEKVEKFDFFNLLNWTPDPYNTSEDLPTDMPEALKQHISNVSGREDANMVWVSCEGETPADMEFIGPVRYLPRQGIPTYYFPYTNQEGYLSPLVAVYFERPAKGIVINVTCNAWAKNITRDLYERRGAVHFELMVD